MKQDIGELFDQELYRSVDKHYEDLSSTFKVCDCNLCGTPIRNDEYWYEFDEFLCCSDCASESKNNPNKLNKKSGKCFRCKDPLTSSDDFYFFKTFIVCFDCIFDFKKSFDWS